MFCLPAQGLLCPISLRRFVPWCDCLLFITSGINVILRLNTLVLQISTVASVHEKLTWRFKVGCEALLLLNQNTSPKSHWCASCDWTHDLLRGSLLAFQLSYRYMPCDISKYSSQCLNVLAQNGIYIVVETSHVSHNYTYIYVNLFWVF